VPIDDPVVKGLAVGTSAHGLGTAALVDDPDAFSFAAIAMALVGASSAIVARADRHQPQRQLRRAQV